MITVELTFERNKPDKKPFSRMYEQTLLFANLSNHDRYYILIRRHGVIIVLPLNGNGIIGASDFNVSISSNIGAKRNVEKRLVRTRRKRVESGACLGNEPRKLRIMEQLLYETG